MAGEFGGKWSTAEELSATRAEVWLPCLGRLSPGFDVVAITEDVRAFLRMDGIMLPLPPPGHELKERDPRHESPEGAEGGLSLDEFPDSPDAASGADADAISEASSLKPPPSMVEFQIAISAVLEARGPMLLPRLSWVTPWDGAWMNGEEAQCGSVGEVLTVLKASDAVTEAMGAALDAPLGGALGPPNATLVLLDFDDVFARPERCFRAFVRGGHVLALSQLRATRFLPGAKALCEIALAAAETLVDDVASRGIDIYADAAIFLDTCEPSHKPAVCALSLSNSHSSRLHGAWQSLWSTAVTHANFLQPPSARLRRVLPAVKTSLLNHSSLVCFLFLFPAVMVDFAVTPKGRPRLLDLQPLTPDSDLLLFEPSDLDDAQARCLADDAAAAEAAIGASGPAFVPEVRLIQSDKEAMPELARRLELMPLPAELAVLMAQATGAAGGAAAAAAGGQSGDAADSLEGAIRLAAAAAQAEQ